MQELYLNFLFSKGYFVGSESNSDHALETLVSLAKLFDIQISSGHEMASKEMISLAERNLGKDVPEAFYRGFPKSVLELVPEQLFWDQLIHYITTYGFGNFSTVGHSMLEKIETRSQFNEKTEPKWYTIISEADALLKLEEYVSALLDSSRPLSDSQYNLVCSFICDYDYKPTRCACKDTAVCLLLDTRKAEFSEYMQLSDVVRLVEQIQYQCYNSTNIKKLNLQNKDRVFIKKVLNTIFLKGKADDINCFEKKKIWNGLLHHIHYKPINDKAKLFVENIRGSQNLSVYSAFEAKIKEGDIRGAAKYLVENKGGTAVLRNLNYLLSRCTTTEDVNIILETAQCKNIIVLIQLLLQYSNYPDCPTGRTFKFTKFNKLNVHKETADEFTKRKSHLDKHIAETAMEQIKKYLSAACKNKLGKVFVDESMKKVALPLQESTSMGGLGVLPKGTRLPIENAKKIRAFTYWEKVDDIDLSIIGVTYDRSQTEFSWRTMFGNQSSALVFSGDETSGYNGGSEYFDIILPEFKETHPECEYLILCDNVYSSLTFSNCVCTAGYMLRDENDSGQVFEPKTVKTSFKITCDSRFAYLFAIDLKNDEFVWLNVARNSNLNVAGMSTLDFLLEYINSTNVINLYDLATMLATEIVDDPYEADIVFSDRELTLGDDTEQIRSCDFEKVLSLMNK